MEAKGGDMGSRTTPLQHPWPSRRCLFHLATRHNRSPQGDFSHLHGRYRAALWPDLRRGHRVLKNRRISRTTIACCLGSLMNVPCDV
jgi:hypothetical protein